MGRIRRRGIPQPPEAGLGETEPGLGFGVGLGNCNCLGLGLRLTLVEMGFKSEGQGGPNAAR